MWAAYAQENGKPTSADEILDAARKFAAFLSEPTTVSFTLDQPNATPAMRAAVRKRASG